MTRPEVKPMPAPARLASLRRLLSCIRTDEVCVLQGAPVIGACFAMTDFNVSTLLTAAALVLGNLLLVAHVFVLNDWSGIQGDLRDPTRATWTYVAKGEDSARIGGLALVLLALSLLVFALINRTSLVIASTIAALSAIYSVKGVHGKGVPLLSSLLHLCGGTLHFLLGYAALSSNLLQGAIIGCYFGLVFAAGHLTHETRDHDGDLHSGIRTNAVAFGRKRTFFASLLLFSSAYMLLTALALLGLVPRVLVLVIAPYAIHLRAAWRTLRDGLTYPNIRRLQTVYRNIHAVIGLVLLATVPPW